MAIISGYFTGESYGLLGPQMAATIIQNNTTYECIVIGVTRVDDRAVLKRALEEYFGSQRPVVAFSALNGREELFSLAREFREQGVFTMLAGPQANFDYMGEIGWHNHSHRFQGLDAHFTCSLHGPAEQVLHVLHGLDRDEWHTTQGLLYRGGDGRLIQNPKKTWDEQYLGKAQWDTLYRIGAGGLVPLAITAGQVLQQIGCPYAARKRCIEIDYPVAMPGNSRVRLLLRGCSFCDVAVDKGFYGQLDMDTVIAQIQCLPRGPDGRKIPFELINENPLPTLSGLLREVKEKGIGISQINLILRADWLVKGHEMLREALRMAREIGVCLLLSSVGFESFDNGQ